MRLAGIQRDQILRMRLVGGVASLAAGEAIRARAAPSRRPMAACGAKAALGANATVGVMMHRRSTALMMAIMG